MLSYSLCKASTEKKILAGYGTQYSLYIVLNKQLLYYILVFNEKKPTFTNHFCLFFLARLHFSAEELLLYPRLRRRRRRQRPCRRRRPHSKC